MAGRQDEPIPIEPVRVLGIILHNLIVQNMAHRSATHRQARMAGICLLHSIDREETDRIDGLLDQRRLSGLIDRLSNRSSNHSTEGPAWPDPSRRCGDGGGVGGFEAGETGKRARGKRNAVGGWI